MATTRAASDGSGGPRTGASARWTRPQSARPAWAARRPARRPRRPGAGIKVTVVGAVVFVYAAIAGVASMRHQQELGRERKIVQGVSDMRDQCRPAPDLVLADRVLVWDVASDHRSGAYDALPGALRARAKDRGMTVVLVLGTRTEQVGTYTISQQPGYRQYVDVCLVHWPDRRVLGMHSVVSSEPPSSRIVQARPEYGDPDAPIANWLSGLRRA
jgi:hypothetical protein